MTRKKEDVDTPVDGRGKPCLYIKKGAEFFCEFGKRLALLGLNDEEMAAALGISRKTLHNYREWFEEFDEAIESGKNEADSKVVAALYKRAVGYEVEDEKIFQHQGVPVIVPYTRIVDPDVTAAALWLRMRQSRNWNKADKHEVSGPNGGPLPGQGPTLDLARLTDDEIKQLEQLTLKALPHVPPESN